MSSLSPSESIDNDYHTDFNDVQSKLPFTKEEIKGIVVAEAPKSSKYANEWIIVGVYFEHEDKKKRHYNGHAFYPSVLFGPGNYESIYSKRIMNVNYVPIDEAKKYALFGYPEKKISKSGTRGVKCPLSIRRFSDFDSSEDEPILDIIFRIGFTPTVFWDNVKVTVIEREYYLEHDKKRGDGYERFLHNKLMSKKFDFNDIEKLSKTKFDILKQEIQKCTSEVLKRQTELVQLSLFISNMKRKVDDYSKEYESDPKKLMVKLPSCD